MHISKKKEFCINYIDKNDEDRVVHETTVKNIEVKK